MCDCGRLANSASTPGRFDTFVDVHAALAVSSTHALYIPPGVAMLGLWRCFALNQVHVE